MTTPEVKQRRSFEELLVDHTSTSPAGMTCVHGIIARRVESTLASRDGGKTIPVDTLDSGCLVLVPHVNPNRPDEAPNQVCIREGEPRNFGTSIATVSAEELMGAVKFAHGMGFSTVAVPTWENGAGKIKDGVKYKVYAKKRPASPAVKTEEVADAGQKDTAERVRGALQS